MKIFRFLNCFMWTPLYILNISFGTLVMMSILIIWFGTKYDTACLLFFCPPPWIIAKVLHPPSKRGRGLLWYLLPNSQFKTLKQNSKVSLRLDLSLAQVKFGGNIIYEVFALHTSSSNFICAKISWMKTLYLFRSLWKTN